MDVRCTRCGTEYEFDDALISERGTSVRCTQCGFQFRVFPPQSKIVGPDEWVVLTSIGRRVVYRTLRELQNGIARGEVAREDLLARGIAPPRPLGSIAELDPLFSTKAMPEHKPSTLTGVAPPPAGTDKKVEDNPLREQHDTWSGVAPPANLLEHAGTRPRAAAPMRVSASRIGVDEPPAAVPGSPPMVQDAAEQAKQAELLARDLVARAGSEPPPTRSYEERAETGPEDSAAATAALGRGRTQLGIGLSAPPSQPNPSAELLAPEAKPAILPESVSKPESKSLVSKEPPVVADVELPPPEPSLTSATGKPLPLSTRSEPPTARIADRHIAVAPNVDKTHESSGQPPVEPVDLPASAPTHPPSRPHRSAPTQPKPQPKPQPTPWFFILLGVGLVSVGLYTGMTLMGQVSKWKPKAVEPSRAAVVVAAASSEAVEPRAANATAIEEAVEAGDYATAQQLLAQLTEAERAQHPYRALSVLSDAIAVDMLWWDKRLCPKDDTSRLSTLDESLKSRLVALNQTLEGCRVDEDCKLKTLPAAWAYHRMSGKPELAQPPRQGTVNANGLYQLAMLDWVRSDKPDSRTQSRLRKARLPGVEQGPWVTALIVALIDAGMLDEARTELAKLASAPKAHSHLEALNRYLRQLSIEAGDAGTPEPADADEKEPDFRIRLQKAAASLARGELTRAQKLYRSVLAEHANDTEAMGGMADVYRRRGELAKAKEQYERVLAVNPNYLPAMVGAADVRWQSGDKAAAVAIYRHIVERVGEGSGYGQTAANRIADFEGGVKPAKPEAAPSAEPEGKSP